MAMAYYTDLAGPVSTSVLNECLVMMLCYVVFHGFGGRLSVMDVGPTTLNQIVGLCFKEISLKKRDLNGKNQFGKSVILKPNYHSDII